MQNSRGKRSSKRSKAVSFERILVQIARVWACLSSFSSNPSAKVTEKDHFGPARLARPKRLASTGPVTPGQLSGQRNRCGRSHARFEFTRLSDGVAAGRAAHAGRAAELPRPADARVDEVLGDGRHPEHRPRGQLGLHARPVQVGLRRPQPDRRLRRRSLQPAARRSAPACSSGRR